MVLLSRYRIAINIIDDLRCPVNKGDTPQIMWGVLVGNQKYSLYDFFSDVIT